MNANEEIEITYEVNNKFYNISGNSNFHYRLQNDSKFCEAYFKTLDSQLPQGVKSVGLQGCQDQGNKENIGEPIPSTSTDCRPVVCTSNNTTEEFKWTRQTTLLLLNMYKEKTLLFRNSKIKNKDIWLHILKEFKKQGYKSATVETLDRKMRNLKKTYKENKDKKNRTGESVITWEFFEAMDDIFFNDRTINPTSIISTMESVSKSSQGSLNSQIGPSIKMSENPKSNNESNKVEKNTQEESLNVSNTENQKSKKNENIHKESIKGSKAKRATQLYDHRKKILEIEKERIEEIKKLRETLETNNKIQEERNQILRQILEK